MDKIHLSIIVPVYNEAQRGILPNAFKEIENYFSRVNYSYEIIFVNDGSTDDSKKLLQEFAHRSNGKASCINNEENAGKGYSVRKGVLASQGKYVLYMDADCAVPLRFIDEFMDHAKEANVIIASIELPGARPVDHNESYRRLTGKLAKWLIRSTILPEIYDSQRGFKLFDGEIARKIFSIQKLDRWGFDMEVLVIARENGYSVKEIPVEWNNPAGSAVKFSAYFNTLFDLARIFVSKITGRYKF